MSAPTLETAPGKPRDVHGTYWFVDHPDGSVSYVLVRRAEAGAPNGMTLAFRGETQDAALAAHEEWAAVQYERVHRNAERRAKWGPLGTGKMA